MKYKSLLTDEIEVQLLIGLYGWWCDIKNIESFGIRNILIGGPELSEKIAKRKFAACAKRNGWTKWRWVE